MVLLLPLLTLVLGVLWARHWRGGERGGLPVPPVAELPADVSGWSGALREPAVEAHLVPLHEDPLRQAFDRDVLARRLGLGEGQPWQLVLRYHAVEGGGGGPIDLGALGVLDSEGAALMPPAAARAPGTQSPADPLAVLLAPPATPMLPGSGISIVLWGPVPSGDARLVGLSAADGELPPLELRAQPVPSDVLPRTLARLERGGGR